MANAELAPNALVKPARGTARRLKARGKRREGVVAKSVRQQCVERDGWCVIRTRMGGLPDNTFLWALTCSGPSEWAHIGKHRRCHTRGQAPEVRHTTQGSAMLCEHHHDAYDAHAFDIVPLDADKGMDGAFRVIARAA